MKIVIIEDEKAAVRNLTSLLNEIKPNGEIVTILDSISSTIEWFSSHPMPELVFMDIHLADGSAFEIFNHINITCPIIFTTAYDEYALRAFKVNSIDYLLKPIGKEDIEHAQTLDELTECLNPSLFFRANRQYLISREAIKDIDLWFNSRLSINLYYSGIKEKILVSKARVAEFKEWFSKRKR